MWAFLKGGYKEKGPVKLYLMLSLMLKGCKRFNRAVIVLLIFGLFIRILFILPEGMIGHPFCCLLGCFILVTKCFTRRNCVYIY